MLESTSTQTPISNLLERRWVGFVYGASALALLTLAALQRTDVLTTFPIALILLIILLAITLLIGLLMSRPRSDQRRNLALPLLLIGAAASSGLVAVTGGFSSPLWVALLLVSTAAPLLLPGPWAAVLLCVVWLVDGLFILLAPPELRIEALLTWSVRVSGVTLIALVLQRALATESALRMRAQRREQVLSDFLLLSNRLRVTSEPQTILEEVARTVQTSGDFDCVTLSRVDWRAGVVTIAVAIGASGRRLKALETLQSPWSDIAPLLSEQRRVGPETYKVETLPFRSIKNEQHLVLPLNSQFAEIQGILTVSFNQQRRETLDEALPLLELLANQAAAALENSALYSTLEQRVHDATATLTRSQEELALARDRAETLYQIVRTLASSLDEREVLIQALELVAQATNAELGGIMLVEPTTGRLVFRTTFDCAQAGPAVGLESGQELAGAVLASKQLALIPDTWEDARWRSRPDPDERSRSVLMAPMLLDNEPLGVLVLTHAQREHFRQEHAYLALAAAGQIAVALSKAQLYRYVSEQSERLGLTLRQREEEISKTQAILRSIRDGVVVGDRLGRVRMVNPAAEELLGISAADLMGQQLRDLPGVPLDHNGNVIDETQQMQVGQRTLRAQHAPVLAASGDWLGGVVIYRDITRDALNDKLKSEFIATASHELRTPLTAVRGYVDLLLLGTLGPLSAGQTDFLKIVKNNVVRLVDLIDDVLDVSKVEAGEIRLRREPTDLAEIVCEVGETLYSQFTERAISLAIDVQQDLPQVIADRQRIRQIALNLISNACKYTPSGGHVDVVLYQHDDHVRMDVRDTGVGISEAARAHIFTPFFRADNPLRDAAGGTGLGLSITKTLIDLHGGHIWFDSHEGEGTTFSFILPLGDNGWAPAEWLEHTV